MTAQHLSETQVSSDGTHTLPSSADTPPAVTGPTLADHPKSRRPPPFLCHHERMDDAAFRRIQDALNDNGYQKYCLGRRQLKVCDGDLSP